MSEPSLEGWNKTRLDRVIDQFIVPMRDKPPAWTGDIPWCRIEDFDGKYLHGSKSHQYVDSTIVGLMNLKVYPTGTLLCSCSATLGICTITARPLVSNQTFIGLVPKPEVSTEFLYYKMISLAGMLQGMSSGTTIAYLPRAKFEALEIELPPRPQQDRIAEILSTVDEAIEQTAALIAKYQQIKAGLMHDLLTRGATPDGHLRPTRAQAPYLYKESPLGWIPKEWSTELLDRLSLRGSGHTPSKNRPDFWNGGIKWVSLADSWRLDRLYISETDKEISQLGIENSSAVLYPPGIVVLSRDAGVGKSAITTCSMAVSQHFMCWRCGPQLDNHYLYYWLQYRKREFENIATGSTIPTIGLRYFRYYRINIPTDVEEQKYISSALLSIDHAIFALETDVEKLRQQKQGLMQDLLTGRVRVKVGVT